MVTRERTIQLNEAQKSAAIQTFAYTAQEATLHIYKILSTGANLFTYCGEITLQKAIERRRGCVKMAKQALRGFIV